MTHCVGPPDPDLIWNGLENDCSWQLLAIFIRCTMGKYRPNMHANIIEINNGRKQSFVLKHANYFTVTQTDTEPSFMSLRYHLGTFCHCVTLWPAWRQWSYTRCISCHTMLSHMIGVPLLFNMLLMKAAHFNYRSKHQRLLNLLISRLWHTKNPKQGLWSLIKVPITLLPYYEWHTVRFSITVTQW